MNSFLTSVCNVSITVAVPTYNRRDSVFRLVQQILPQLNPEDEILVVDDGSSDGTAEALSTLSRVRIVCNSPNKGMVNTWNTCLTAAQCEWVCIIHDDDVIAPYALKSIRQACELVGGPALIEHALESETEGDFRCRVSAPGSWAVLHAETCPSGVTVHRDIIRAIGLFDIRYTYSTDLEYFPRICAHYPSLVIESPTVVEYQLHNENYQYKTWRQPDFLAQLLEIEQQIVQYAGLNDDEASWRVYWRMSASLMHMLRNAQRIGDRALVRQTSRLLRHRTGLGRRRKAMFYIASVLGWAPEVKP